MKLRVVGRGEQRAVGDCGDGLCLLLYYRPLEPSDQTVHVSFHQPKILRDARSGMGLSNAQWWLPERMQMPVSYRAHVSVQIDQRDDVVRASIALGISFHCSIEFS